MRTFDQRAIIRSVIAVWAFHRSSPGWCSLRRRYVLCAAQDLPEVRRPHQGASRRMVACAFEEFASLSSTESSSGSFYLPSSLHGFIFHLLNRQSQRINCQKLPSYKTLPAGLRPAGSKALLFQHHAASWGDFAFQKPIRHRNIGRLPKHDLPVFLAIIGDLRFLRGIRNVECDDKRFPVEGA